MEKTHLRQRGTNLLWHKGTPTGALWLVLQCSRLFSRHVVILQCHTAESVNSYLRWVQQKNKWWSPKSMEEYQSEPASNSELRRFGVVSLECAMYTSRRRAVNWRHTFSPNGQSALGPFFFKLRLKACFSSPGRSQQPWVRQQKQRQAYRSRIHLAVCRGRMVAWVRGVTEGKLRQLLMWCPTTGRERCHWVHGSSNWAPHCVHRRCLIDHILYSRCFGDSTVIVTFFRGHIQ